jgi:hypothetical protein
VRLDSAVGSDTSRVEDPVKGTLSDAVVLDGFDVFAAGSVVRGEVAAVARRALSRRLRTALMPSCLSHRLDQ